MAEERWDGERAERWLRQAAGLERQLAPVSDRLFAAAALAPGEHVLDVGCGTGPTTREAAGRVAPGGTATGLDLSGELLAAAARATDDPAVRWVEADVVAWEPDRAYDVVLSRFGVMFFSDPAAAFATLARATRPGGRLAVAVWARRDLSPLFEVPLRAVLVALGEPAEPLPVGDGPFSLHDRAATTALLEGAGWSGVGWDEQDLPLLFAGGVDPAGAAVASEDFGPTRLALGGAGEADRARAREAVAAALADHVDGDGHVVLAGRVVVVTATR